MFSELQNFNSPFIMDFHLWLYGEQHRLEWKREYQRNLMREKRKKEKI